MPGRLAPCHERAARRVIHREEALDPQVLNGDVLRCAEGRYGGEPVEVLAIFAEIFDEAARYEALASPRLAGAALDVWYRYPSMPGPAAPANLPFGKLDNIIMTPHVSGWTGGMLAARAQVIADNIARIARGEEPMNAISAHP